MRWSHLLFTRLIPIVSLVVFRDGIVSALRTYSLDEQRALVAEVHEGASHEWETGGQSMGAPFPMIHFMGVPRGA